MRTIEILRNYNVAESNHWQLMCDLSNDDYGIMIGSNYKLIKFYDGKKSFKDTLLGSDIGIHSHGFVNVAIISTLLAIGALLVGVGKKKLQ